MIYIYYFLGSLGQHTKRSFVELFGSGSPSIQSRYKSESTAVKFDPTPSFQVIVIICLGLQDQDPHFLPGHSPMATLRSQRLLIVPCHMAHFINSSHYGSSFLQYHQSTKTEIYKMLPNQDSAPSPLPDNVRECLSHQFCHIF